MQSWDRLIKSAAREVIVDFVQHVQREVKQGNPFFMESGVDEDFDRYEALFQRSMTSAFGVYERVPNEVFGLEIITSCSGCIAKSLRASKYRGLVDGKIALEAVVDVGLYVLGKAREEHFRITPDFIEEWQS